MERGRVEDGDTDDDDDDDDEEEGEDGVGGVGDGDRLVTDWKFDQLDKNGDGQLNRREFRVLRRPVRRVVRPKRCTKNFPRYCDQDQDRRISKSEWSVCLGVGINSRPLTLATFYGFFYYYSLFLRLLPGIFLGITEFRWLLLGLTGFYWVIIGCYCCLGIAINSRPLLCLQGFFYYYYFFYGFFLGSYWV